jgi:hypothetical protein
MAQSSELLLGTLNDIWSGPEVTKLASRKTRRSDTRAWVTQFGHERRDEITTAMLQQQIDGEIGEADAVLLKNGFRFEIANQLDPFLRGSLRCRRCNH